MRVTSHRAALPVGRRSQSEQAIAPSAPRTNPELVKWASTARIKTVPHLFLAAVARHPDAPYLTMGDETLTYGQALEKTRAFASGLIELGVRPGEWVNSYANNSIRWRLADFAIQFAGAAHPALHNQLAEKKVSHVIKDSAARLIIVDDGARLQQVLGRRAEYPKLEAAIVMDDAADLSKFRDSGLKVHGWAQVEELGRGALQKNLPEIGRRLAQLGPESIGRPVYTSGSSGNPKGVLLTQGGQVATVEGAARVLNRDPQATLETIQRPDARYVSVLPGGHVFGAVAEYEVTAQGGQIVYPEVSSSQAGNEAVVRAFMKAVRTSKPTILAVTPGFFNLITNLASKNSARDKTPVLSAGALTGVLSGAGAAVGAVGGLLSGSPWLGAAVGAALGGGLGALASIAQKKGWIQEALQAVQSPESTPAPATGNEAQPGPTAPEETSVRPWHLGAVMGAGAGVLGGFLLGLPLAGGAAGAVLGGALTAAAGSLASITKGDAFAWALDTATDYYRNYGNVSLPKRLQFAAADKLVFPEIARGLKKATGGELEVALSGGAALGAREEAMFRAGGIHIAQGYGQTETGGATLVNDPYNAKYGTVGKPIPGVDIRLDPKNHEIQLRGPGMMLGYHGLPEKTAKAFTADGWLKTEDIGKEVEIPIHNPWQVAGWSACLGAVAGAAASLALPVPALALGALGAAAAGGLGALAASRNTDTFYAIAGRLASQRKLPRCGEFLTPEPLEESLQRSRYIKTALVTGGSEYRQDEDVVGALLVPNFAEVADWAIGRGILAQNSSDAEELKRLGQRLVREGNPQVKELLLSEARRLTATEEGFERFMKVDHVALVDREWTLENDEVTAKGNVVRNKIEGTPDKPGAFREQIEAMFG
ncbi:MAG: AMP-binding protein [Armatimonadetes bacterium]|nr:AMP-binding protein [Armatimonadota bacterium]